MILTQDKTFYQEFVSTAKEYLLNNFNFNLSENLFNTVEVILWIGFLFLLDFLLRFFTFPIIKKIAINTDLIWVRTLWKQKVITSIIHLIPLILASKINSFIFQKNSTLLFLVQKVTELIIVIVFTQLIFRIINTIIVVYNSENSYTTVGVRTFGQMMKILVAFFAVLSGVMILFTVNTNTIITVLGAMTAAVLLIFRDAIFGFVSGLQIAYSKVIKVGDWITISKGDIEGIVKEININLVRIQKFDKTIATIPTVDVVTSQVTNHMPMMASGTRQIKRSISFNINSFSFCTKEMLTCYKEINILKDYILAKEKEIEDYNKNLNNLELSINGRQLTNIGTFRMYMELYLKNNSKISQRDSIIVKQLPATMEGLPIEINCFVKATNNIDFERVQSDIFDHFLTACKVFDLQIMQSISASDIKH